MKITIFGLTLSSSWGNGHATPYRAIIRALDRKGHKVVFFEKDVDYYARRRDFSQWPHCDLVLYGQWEDVRRHALDEAATSDAIIVASYCPQGSRIADEVLDLWRPVHVFYDLDTPITLNNLRRGNLEYLCRDQIGQFDLYLSFTGGRILDELENCWGARRARPLHGCVDPDMYPRVQAHEDFRCDLSYMGTYAADRQDKLDALFLEPARRLNRQQFVLAGSLYPWQWRWPENVRRFEHIAPADHPGFYSSSRVTLNITRGEMARAGYCPSGRFFEAASCGAAILTDTWDGLDSFFTLGEEIVPVSSAEDVVRALELPEDELAAVANRARQRTLDEHTGEHRANELLQWIEEARRPVPMARGAQEAA
ncbi:MAG: glycosyltransferase [Acidobacteria bacterium]|nr:glycosyltransferase [Acidobacteriota bacterium]